MSKLLEGKVVAITGAGGGLGRAHALYMAREGAKLVINDLGGARDGTGSGSAMADKVVDEIKALGGRAVANYGSVATMEGARSIVQSAVSAFGRLDGLVNNAGILRDKTLLKMTEEMFDLVIAVHLRGTFCCTLAAAKQMTEQGEGGSIINTTSIAGLKGNYGQTNYAAAKAGIYAMTLVHSMELARSAIRVNAVAPIAKTRMTEDISGVPDEMTPEHVAPLVAFLASERAKGVSGRIFGVHGPLIFEYKMHTSDGVRLDGWTPELIGQRLAEIAGEVPVAAAAPAPRATAPSSPAPAPAAAAAAVPSTPQEKVAAIFKFMPAGFDAEKAAGWKAVLHWEIAGTGDFTISAADGKCTSSPGKVGTPTCVVKTDTSTFLGIIDGSVDGTQAFMQGKFSATNVSDLMKYRKSIDGKKVRGAFEASLKTGGAAPTQPLVAGTATAVAAAVAPQAAAAGVPSTPQEKVAAIFKFMPAGFDAEKAGGWRAVLHWEIAGTGDFTISASDGKCTSSPGKVGSPTCVVKTDTATFLGIIDGSVDGTQAFMQGKFSATNVSDLMKYRKSIDGKKVRAAFEASLKSAAPAVLPASAAAVTAPALAPAATAPAAVMAPSSEALEAMRPIDRLRALFGLLPELAGSGPAPQPLCIHVTAGELRCTVERNAGKLAVEAGHHGQPTSRIVATADALWQILTGAPSARELFAQAALSATSMAELRWLIKACGDNPKGALARELEGRGAGMNRAKIGALYHGDPIVIHVDEIKDFAEATNDPNPRFVDGKRDGGLVAPPLFPVRYFNTLWGKVLTDPELKADLPRLLFGEMDMRFIAPVRPKDVVVCKARVLSIEDKDTGQVLRVSTRLMCDGEAKADAVATFFVRWSQAGRIKRLQEVRSTEARAPGAVAFQEPMKIRPEQTRLFAKASNDPNPVHLDDNFAKAVGLPGIIVHGLCSMAFCGRSFVEKVCGGDPNRLVGLKVRFSKPARPGQTLTTRAFAPVEEDGLKVYAFDASNELGENIITEGVARIK